MSNSGGSTENLNAGMNMDSEGQACEVSEGRRTLSEIGLKAFHLHDGM